MEHIEIFADNQQLCSFTGKIEHVYHTVFSQLMELKTWNVDNTNCIACLKFLRIITKEIAIDMFEMSDSIYDKIMQVEFDNSLSDEFYRKYTQEIQNNKEKQD